MNEWKIVPFFAQASADISRITGPIRSLAERVGLATGLGAVAYVPSGRGSQDSEDLPDEDGEDE